MVSANLLEVDGLNLPNVFTDNPIVTSIASQTRGIADAGKVSVTVTDILRLIGGGQINSSTYAAGNGGEITIHAKDVEIDGLGSNIVTGIASQTEAGSTGSAGKVTVTAEDTLRLLAGGIISTNAISQSQGNAGEVTVNAKQLEIDGEGFTNILTFIGSQSDFSSGSAGHVIITVTDTLKLLAGGIISSSSFGQGEAGGVTIVARQMDIDRSQITSSAAGKNAQTGNIEITVQDDIHLRNNSFISTTNLATTTDLNIQAGGININLGKNGSLHLDSSQINTESVIGHGGKIDINAKEVISLFNSSVTTSVYGPIGNGGDINLASNFLILDTGFIKANTLAANASGGDININPSLTSYGQFLLYFCLVSFLTN